MLLPRDYSKLIEYLSFFLQCATMFILGATAYYDYSLLKMAEAMTFNDFFLEVTYGPDVKRQKLTECVLTRNS